MPTQPAASPKTITARVIIGLQTGIYWLAVYWLPVALLVPLTIFMLALLAPALLAVGQTGAAQTVYGWLAPHDHQLPQRSYFLFGATGPINSYSLEQVLAWGAAPDNLRAFVGDAQIGFKMGLNQRMTAIFLASLLAGIVWISRGGRPKVGPAGLVITMLPLLVDGFSHLLSETGGAGFRAGNAWAVALTGGTFGPEFYAGSTVGSLNWLLRTVTGLLFGLGFTWFLLTFLEARFTAIRAQLAVKLRRR